MKIPPKQVGGATAPTLPEQAATPAQSTAAPTKTAEAKKGWQAAGPRAKAEASTKAAADQPLAAARRALTGLATTAVAKAIASATPQTPVTHDHPLLRGFGEALGLGLGVVVTEALAAVPSWNKPVLDASGKPVASVEGAQRIGNHDILKRHEEVVGPQVAALVDKLSPGALHDLLDGFAKGATAAPGTSYRLEAEVSDAISKR